MLYYVTLCYGKLCYARLCYVHKQQTQTLLTAIAIFASLAPTHTHKVRDFPQAEFDGEINARFFSNEHGDLYFIT